MAIIDVESLRDIQWDKSNLWEISIEDNTFLGFVPSNDISMGFFGIGTEQVGSSAIEFPATRTVPTFNLSYYDDEDLTQTKFFTEWLRSMVSLDSYRVELLENAHKLITISKLNSKRQIIWEWVFHAFPTGNIEYHGDSDGSLPIYTLNFIVSAGSMKWKAVPTVDSISFNSQY